MEVLREYGVASTILFPLIKKGSMDFETGATFVAADTQISKNEGTFANTSNTPVHEGNGIYSLLLTATEMQAARISITCVDATATKVWEDQAILIQTYNHVTSSGLGYPSVDARAIDLSTGASNKLKTYVNSFTTGVIDTTAFSPTTTEFESDTVTEATADHYIGMRITFGTGPLTGQGTEILDYVLTGGRGHFTVAQMTDAPADNNVFMIHPPYHSTQAGAD